MSEERVAVCLPADNVIHRYPIYEEDGQRFARISDGRFVRLVGIAALCPRGVERPETSTAGSNISEFVAVRSWASQAFRDRRFARKSKRKFNQG